MRKTFSCGIAAVCFAAFSLSSQLATAQPMRAVFEGYFDEVSLSGELTTSTALAEGQRYSLTFEYDPDTAGAQRVTTSNQDSVSGGGDSSFIKSPIHRVMMKVPEINLSWVIAAPAGGSKKFNGNAFITSTATSRTFGIGAGEGDKNPFFQSIAMAFENNLAALPASLDTAFTLDLRGQRVGEYGTFKDGLDDLFVGLAGDRVTVSRNDPVDPSPVPLPAALPMLALAIAVAGTALRRKRN